MIFQKRLVLHKWVLPGALAIVACTDNSPSIGPRQSGELRDILSAAALGSLDASGRFVLTAPDRSARDQIDEEKAEELARALIATYAPLGGLPAIDAGRGRAIDQGSLVTCRRTMYAKSPWEPLAADIARTPGGAVVQRAHGPYWLVPFCDPSGALAMLISVSAYAVDLSVVDGKVRFPPVGGEWFHWSLIPKGQRDELPMGPEEAALEIAALTGARITSVPELIAPSRSEGFPADARWHIRLDAVVEVQIGANGKRVQSADLYASWRPKLERKAVEVAPAAQIPAEEVDYVEDLGSEHAGEGHRLGKLTLRRNPGLPVTFEVLTRTSVVKGGASWKAPVGRP